MRSCSWRRDVESSLRLDKEPAGLCDSWALIERQNPREAASPPPLIASAL